jgi:hypothetical protein
MLLHWPAAWYHKLDIRRNVMPSPFRNGSIPSALGAIYDEADYPLTLDYNQPPPEPALSETDAAWAAERIQQWRDQ